MLFLNQPISSRKKDKTNVSVRATFAIKKQPFILEKRWFFCQLILAYSQISLFQKSRRPRCAALTDLGLPSSKKIKRNIPQSLIVPFIKLKSAKNGKILLECAVSTSTARHILKGMLLTKEKLKFDVNTIPDLIRDEKYVDNIHIFHFL